MTEKRDIELTVNDRPYAASVESRTTLSDCLRDEFNLTGTHLGCEHGVCGACTVLMDGKTVRSCLLFAVQAEGHTLTTVEGLPRAGETLHPLQQAFSEAHGLQCGFCTPGFLMSAHELLSDDPDPDEQTIRARLSGNICRCTGYQKILEAVSHAAANLRAEQCS